MVRVSQTSCKSLIRDHERSLDVMQITHKSEGFTVSIHIMYLRTSIASYVMLF